MPPRKLIRLPSERVVSSETIVSQIKAIPHAWALIAVGVVLLLITLKVGKFVMKLFLALIALTLIAGAVWWYMHRH